MGRLAALLVVGQRPRAAGSEELVHQFSGDRIEQPLGGDAGCDWCRGVGYQQRDGIGILGLYLGCSRCGGGRLCAPKHLSSRFDRPSVALDPKSLKFYNAFWRAHFENHCKRQVDIKILCSERLC